MDWSAVETQIHLIATECEGVFNECATDSAWSEQTWIHPAQARFSLWCSGLKATRSDKSSLDHRLRGQPEVKKVVCNLLTGLIEALRKSERFINGTLTRNLA